MSAVDTHNDQKTEASSQVEGLDSVCVSCDIDENAPCKSMFRRMLPVTALGVAWSALPSIAGIVLLLNLEPIRLMLVGDTGSTSQLAIGLGVYAVCFVFLAGFGCLPTVSQAVLAGYAFGFWVGFPAAMVGFAGASLIGYQLVHRITRNRVEHEIKRSKKISMVRDALLKASSRRAILIVGLLRASPSAPFALTNLVLGSLGVSRGVFFVGTVLGMIPRTVAAVIIGASITSWTGDAEMPRWLLYGGLVAVVALLVVISKVSASTLAKISVGGSDS